MKARASPGTHPKYTHMDIFIFHAKNTVFDWCAFVQGFLSQHHQISRASNGKYLLVPFNHLALFSRLKLPKCWIDIESITLNVGTSFTLYCVGFQYETAMAYENPGSIQPGSEDAPSGCENPLSVQPVAYHMVNRRYSEFLNLQTRLEEKTELRKLIKGRI